MAAVFGVMTATLSGCDMLSLLDTGGLFGSPSVMRSGSERESSSSVNSNRSSYSMSTMHHTSSREPDGWSLLIQDRPASARHRFDAQLARSPRDVTPRIGAALASALMGDYSCAVKVMREALLLDPNALRTLPVSAGLMSRIDLLVEEYVEIVFDHPDDDDARFMLASLHYMRRDARTARLALGEPPANDWSLKSTRMLQALINRRDVGSFASRTTRRPAPYAWNEVLPNVSGRTPPAAIPPAADSPPAKPVRPEVTSEAPEPVRPEVTPKAPDPPARPSRPVDYDRLQRDLTGAADALDRFNRKLIEQLERYKGGPASGSKGENAGTTGSSEKSASPASS